MKAAEAPGSGNGGDRIGFAVAGLEGMVAGRAIDLAGQSAEAAQLRIGELEAIAEALSDAIVERDRQIVELRAERDGLRESNAQIYESLADAAEEVEQLRAAARGQATRIRMQALRHAVRFAGRTTAAGAERELDTFGATAAAPGFHGTVRVDIGPISDFDQLMRLESALVAIDGVAGAQVRRFSAGRANFSLLVDTPTDLASAITAIEGFEPVLREVGQSQLVVDLGAGSATAAA